MPRQKKQRLQQRSDGRYKCSYHGHQFYGGTPDEAIAKRDEYKRLESVRDYNRQNPTVKWYAEEWLKHQSAGSAYQTKKEKASLIKKLVSSIGNMYLRDVRASDIKNLYTTGFADYSGSYIRRASQIYRAIFDAAVEDGILKNNPARQNSAKPHKGTASESRAITAQERGWIENLCTDHRAHAAIIAMLYAGIRPQEAKALDIDRDIDLEAETITVRETAHLVASNKYEITNKMKTDFSRRIVPLFPPLKKAIAGKSGMLIQSTSGKALTVQAWKSLWSSYKHSLETAINGCPERWYGKKTEHKGKNLRPFIHISFTPYDLRHSFCTMCRDNGVELNTCIHWMGHADAKMILKIYDEYSADRGAKEAEKLTKKLFSGSEEGSNEKTGAKAPDNSTDK